jgi:hypothetical protein
MKARKKMNEDDVKKMVENLGFKVADDDMMDELANEDAIVACMPCDIEDATIMPGSKKGICGECKTDIWVSPATEKLAYTVRHRCIRCATEMIDELEKE